MIFVFAASVPLETVDPSHVPSPHRVSMVYINPALVAGVTDGPPCVYRSSKIQTHPKPAQARVVGHGEVTGPCEAGSLDYQIIESPTAIVSTAGRDYRVIGAAEDVVSNLLQLQEHVEGQQLSNMTVHNLM